MSPAQRVRLPNGTIVRVDTSKFGTPGLLVKFFRGETEFEGLPELAHALVRAFRFDGLGRPVFLLAKVPTQYQEALSRASVVTESGEPIRPAMTGQAAPPAPIRRRRSRWGRYR